MRTRTTEGRCPARAVAAIVFLGAIGCRADEPGTDGAAGQDACAAGLGHGAGAEMDGPSAPVEIVVDDAGTPHITAEDAEDLFFASGWWVARQRLVQLDLLRRAATGRLAELLGEDYLESDVAARVFGFWRAGCASMDALAAERPDDARLVEAWVAGINRRVAEVLDGSAELPAEYAEWGAEPEPFTVDELMAVGKRIQFGLGNTIASDLFYAIGAGVLPRIDDLPAFLPVADEFIMESSSGGAARRASPGVALRLAPDAAVAVLDAAAAIERNHGAAGASNSWVVSGSATATGRPLLANDPHSTLGLPSYLLTQHLRTVDGEWDVAGWAFVGTPGIQLGHGRTLAWAATTARIDQMDIWDVPADGDDAVRLGGERVELDVSEEVVRVRRDDGGLDEHAVTVRWVPGLGPVLDEQVLPVPSSALGDGVLVLGWPGYDATVEVSMYLDLDRARDLDDFEAAVALQHTSPQNWIGVTAEGWRYRVFGRVPDRGPVETRGVPYAILDGSDPDQLWTHGDLGPEALPALDDDGRDFLVTANNDPWGHTADGDPADDEFYYGAWFAPGFRAERIAGRLAELAAAGGVSVEDAEALQLDVHSGLAERLLPWLDAAWAAAAEDPELADYRDDAALADAVARLAAWDREMAPDSEEAALFRVWVAEADRELLDDDLLVLFESVEALEPLLVHKLALLSLERGIEAVTGDDWPRALLDALRSALDWLETEAEARGVDALTWGDLHVASLEPIAGEAMEVPVGGDGSTVNVASCSMWSSGALRDECRTGHAAVFRQVTTFREDGRPEMRFNWPMGDTGEAEAWRTGTYTVMPFDDDEIEARAAERLVLE